MRVTVRDLEVVVNDLRSSTDLGAVVSVMRDDLPSLAPDSHWPLIDDLPLICPGMAISRKRTGEETCVYNGVALLQISDLTTAAEVAAVKQAAEVLPMTLLAATGSSDRTVKILVSGLLADGTLPATPERIDTFHRQLYNVACRTYGAILPHGVKKIDVSPRDTFRWTYDPDLYYNPDAAPFRIAVDAAHSPQMSEAETAAPYGAGTASPETYPMWTRRFSQAVDKAWTELCPEGRDPEGKVDYETMLSLTARAAHELDIPVEESVQRAMHHHFWYRFGDERVRAIVETAYKELSRQNPVGDRASMQDLTFRLQAWVQSRYDLRYNELANGVEWRANTSYGHSFRPLDSRVMNTMIQEANEAGLEIYDRDMKRYLGSSRIRDFNEAHSYLQSVGHEWDGRTDYIRQLAARVPTSDSHWADWFHTWFLGVVAQWMNWDNRHGNSVVPLLVGPQGCGKSTFGQILLPPQLRDVGYKELVDFSSKQDAERMLTNSLLINLDEFNQISEKTQQGFLKNLIQKSSVKGRRPYSSTVVNLPRYASFIATTNIGGALSDPSGSRRFIVVEIADGAHIDTETPIPYDKLYAQAQAELMAGARYWFSPDDVRQLEQHNMRTETQRPVVQHFLETYEPCLFDEEDTCWLRVGEMLVEMRRRTGLKIEGNAEVFLGRWLRNETRCGRLSYKRSGGIVRYLVRKV